MSISAQTQAAAVVITLPDGSTRSFEGPVTGGEIAAAIGKGLARAAVAMRVDGVAMDLSRVIDRNASVAIITRDSADGLELLRHDAAHVLAEAVKELWPDVQITIGPVITDGFYYDIARDEPFAPEDLAVIEARMREIVKRDEPISREVWEREAAIQFFKDMGEHYKAEIIEDLPRGEDITLYRQGDFIDLCRGPHLPSTGKLGTAFKLLSVAGAYWRGDSRNAMLQRIYGTAWHDDKALADYVHRREEAEKRDHRRLGRDLGLFHMQEEAAGSTFWHPKGTILWRIVEEYMRGRIAGAGYQEIRTPQLMDRSLWEASGHWEKFGEHMFTSQSKDDRVLALKPMNCPGHVQIFKQGLKSYRDLPVRFSEFGCCHRNEPSGALHGLMRVRQFYQDDAHIFCTQEQLVTEVKDCCDLLYATYTDFGFSDIEVKFADRPSVRVGDDATWDRAEAALLEATEAAGLETVHNPGEGAFYGPKLEFHLRDAIGRQWQCGTIQMDFVLPERLDATYIGEDGGKHRPAMIHRAILGSIDRFLGILIEHYAGHFPLWLAPQQLAVATITNDADDYAGRVLAACRAAGLRGEIDKRNEKISYKVREHSLQKVPAILVVGRREAEEGTVAVRRLGSQAQETLTLEQVVASLVAEARVPTLGHLAIAGPGQGSAVAGGVARF
ncbi:MAG: threonine--tRNA ligase [Alphaproteobacteria bacterium]